MTALSFQAYGRFYPFKGTFFLTGMLGYAMMVTDFSGKMVVGGNEASLSESFTRGYFNFGAMVGWKINFGDSRFYFEPSVGWFGALGLGDTFGTQLAKHFGDDDFDIKGFDKNFFNLEHFLFVGGPRVAITFGFRF